METKLAEVRDYEQLASSIELAKDIITKDYLYQLEKYEVCQIPDELRKIEISEYTRLYHFRKLVSDKNENMIDKLVTVLNAAYTSEASVISLIKGQNDCTDYYLGIVSKDVLQRNSDVGTQGATFKGALLGNFPGLEVDSLTAGEIGDLCDSIFAYDYVTSVSGIASLRTEKDNGIEKYVQGIEHLVDSLQNREYSIVVIADPVKINEITLAKNGYENLYTQLSPFLKTSLSFNESSNITVTQSHTSGMTESIGESVSLTQNYSTTNGWSETSTHGTNHNKSTGSMIGTLLGAGVGAAAAVLTGGAAIPLIGVAATMGGIAGQGLIGSSGTNDSDSFGRNGSDTHSTGETKSKNSSSSKQDSDTESQAEGESQGRSIQFENENKTVKNLLTSIDKNIERLEKCEAYGAFNCAAYVISSDPETNAIVSNGYNALMRGENSALQASYINNWNCDDYQADGVKEYLKKFSHPLFYRNGYKDVVVSPASMANSYEVAVNIGIPKKSINGLPVFESAAFGRNIFVNGTVENRSGKINLGKIYHMGATEPTEVNLDKESLAMHTFITGSTGSGKSNTVYQLLEKLEKQNVNYLVIEPAKGEYKNVVGYLSGAKVFGTNPAYTELLKINPFKFPQGIHVLEHIDRLIEIFNVCWPMYAAMPAVLKEAVLQAYEMCGWDLVQSVNLVNENLFPTFKDLLTELVDVIEHSSYDVEVKSNYRGSLETRVKSLTNGLNGLIFASNEIDNAILFDSNVVVDLSRVGSLETKALIMGILVMRLNEYRMTNSERMNLPLKHVTVLEEAHNILKRTSGAMNPEGSNIDEKSVEMLSNAIAEMRTYGEGFIIADQSPNEVAMSAIRNTNTKIIMRLPDEADRRLVGKSAALKDEQLDEISRLPKGVAVVYQNDWLEPVLCKIDKYQGKEKLYAYDTMENIEIKKDSEFKYDLLKLLMKERVNEPIEVNIEKMKEELPYAELATKHKIIVNRLLKEYEKSSRISLWNDEKFDLLSVLTSEILDCRSRVRNLVSESQDFNELDTELQELIHLRIPEASDQINLAVRQCLMKDVSLDNPENIEIYSAWRKYVEKRGILA